MKRYQFKQFDDDFLKQVHTQLQRVEEHLENHIHSANDKTELKKDIQKKAFSVPIAFDNEREIRGDYQVKYLPQVVYIDETGNVKNVWVGYNSKIKSDIREYINDYNRNKGKTKKPTIRRKF